MGQSAAIRCLILLGLQVVALRAVDPKDKTTFEGNTLPLLRFYTRGRVKGWLEQGTAKAAKQRPPAEYKPARRSRPRPQVDIDGALERALARSKQRGS